ncbi:hypothetical protein HK102_011681 [Quaeritorhiza haematococci]|nr:hypothetical protein HK102_011681 [Quaeritorhiza haematococci]
MSKVITNAVGMGITLGQRAASQSFPLNGAFRRTLIQSHRSHGCPNSLSRRPPFNSYSTRSRRSQYRQQQQQYQEPQPPHQEPFHFQQQEVTLTPPPKLQLLVGGYLALINIGAFGLFAYDKFQATRSGWRVRERDLQLSALLGGWIGGFAAMATFRHKTIKQKFLQPYYAAVVGNVAVLGLAVVGWRFSPAFRTSVWRALA